MFSFLYRPVDYSFINSAYPSNITPYPSNRLNKSTNFKTMFDTVRLPYNKKYDNCKGQFCYTYSKGTFIYKPHTDIGNVGTTAAGYLGQRKRM